MVASTGVDFEIVVVDDHSPDDGRAVVQRFMDDHPECRCCCSAGTSTGPAAARNLAVAAARAERSW